MDNFATAKEMQACFDICIRELSRLYSERKALPHDVDQYGNTILHRACSLLATGGTLSITVMDTDLVDVFFQFLRRLQELGVPLNTVNAEGRTCAIDLVVLYRSQQSYHYSLVTSLNQKMLDLGAELSPITNEALWGGWWYGFLRPMILALEFAKCPDLAEAVGCNDVGLAVLAESETLLHQAIKRYPHQIDEPNMAAQTPLHLSVRWPKGIKILIDADADINAGYDQGWPPPIFYAAFWHAHESIRLLLEKDCCMHIESPPRMIIDATTLLKYAIKNENSPDPYAKTRVSIKDARLTVEIIASALSTRRRSLENLAMIHLPQVSIMELGIRLDRVLDSKAGKAIEMLEMKKVSVSPSLRAIETEGQSVYHTGIMNLQQAELLWQSGFRDIDALDKSGLSPLMCAQQQYIFRDFEEVLALPSWFLSKGANRYQLQRHPFRTSTSYFQLKRHRSRTGSPATRSSIHKPWLMDSSSSVAAIHYLGQRLGRVGICLQGQNSDRLRKNLVRIPVQWSHSFLKDSYLADVHSSELLGAILGDPLRDSCQCACSSSGCLSFTQMSKQPSLDSINHLLPSEAFKAALVDTYCTALILDVDNKPELAWVRSEMFRFHTFQKLNLRHTCCTTDHRRIIAELGDEEDRHEIRLEQEEQVAKLEALIEEFESEYQVKGIPIIDFFEGYWQQRMEEVMKEKSHVDKEKLNEIGVVLHEEDDESEGFEHNNIVLNGQTIRVTTQRVGKVIRRFSVGVAANLQDGTLADCADGQPTAQLADLPIPQDFVVGFASQAAHMARALAAKKAALAKLESHERDT